jgi:hypothetical protein
MGANGTSGGVTKGYTTDVVSLPASYLSGSLDISGVLVGKDISSSVVTSYCVGRVKVALMVGSCGMLSSESEESLKGTTSSRATRVVARLDGFSSTSFRCPKKSSVST